MKTRIMYIEHKGLDIVGEARIGRVSFSKTGKSIYYKDHTFQTLNGTGYKSNYIDLESGNEYWISGCHKYGNDRLYCERTPVYLDKDVQEEHWTEIRDMPEMAGRIVINGHNSQWKENWKMSRSKKKTPIRGITTARSEKQDKRDANRKFRRKTKQQVNLGDETISEIREISNVWAFDKDGKHYNADISEKEMRK